MTHISMSFRTVGWQKFFNLLFEFLQGVSNLHFLMLMCFIYLMGLLFSVNVIIFCLSVNFENISANSVLHLLVLFSTQISYPHVYNTLFPGSSSVFLCISQSHTEAETKLIST
jgi:hypothetical protein